MDPWNAVTKLLKKEEKKKKVVSCSLCHVMSKNIYTTMERRGDCWLFYDCPGNLTLTVYTHTHFCVYSYIFCSV